MNFIIWESVIRGRSLRQTGMGIGDMLDEVVQYISLRMQSRGRGG